MTPNSIFEDFSNGEGFGQFSNAGKKTDDPLEGYDTGYKAGWEDALKANQESNAHLSSSLARNLEQIEFTMTEAQNKVLASLRPVLTEIVTTLLPSLASTSLQSLVTQEIEPLIKQYVPNEISLAVSITDEPTIAALLNSSPVFAGLSLSARDTIGEGQVYVACPDGQRKVDLNAAILEIQSRLTDFLQQPELERENVI